MALSYTSCNSLIFSSFSCNISKTFLSLFSPFSFSLKYRKQNNESVQTGHSRTAWSEALQQQYFCTHFYDLSYTTMCKILDESLLLRQNFDKISSISFFCKQMSDMMLSAFEVWASKKCPFLWPTVHSFFRSPDSLLLQLFNKEFQLK